MCCAFDGPPVGGSKEYQFWHPLWASGVRGPVRDDKIDMLSADECIAALSPVRARVAAHALESQVLLAGLSSQFVKTYQPMTFNLTDYKVAHEAHSHTPVVMVWLI